MPKHQEPRAYDDEVLRYVIEELVEQLSSDEFELLKPALGDHPNAGRPDSLACAACLYCLAMWRHSIDLPFTIRSPAPRLLPPSTLGRKCVRRRACQANAVRDCLPRFYRSKA